MSMTVAFFAIGLILTISFVILVIFSYHAPMGWEDDEGFHYGAVKTLDDYASLRESDVALGSACVRCDPCSANSDPEKLEEIARRCGA